MSTNTLSFLYESGSVVADAISKLTKDGLGVYRVAREWEQKGSGRGNLRGRLSQPTARLLR